MLRHRSSSLSRKESRSQILSGGSGCGNAMECSETLTSTTSASASAAMVVHKLKLLIENGKYDDCATMIRRLSSSVVEATLAELPVVDVIASVPSSLVALDAIYSKVAYLDPKSPVFVHLRPATFVSYVVRWLSDPDGNGPRQRSAQVPHHRKGLQHYRPVLCRIFAVVDSACPHVADELRTRSATLSRCLAGLGEHGLVRCPSEPAKMTTIYDALKGNCVRTAQLMKTAVHRLDEIGPTQSRIRIPVHRDFAPVSASHQRQVQVTVKEVEDRLIANKTLLDAVESGVSEIHAVFDDLLKALRRRIENDKEVLSSLTELRRAMPAQSLSTGGAIMPHVQQLVGGYGAVIDIFEEISQRTMHENDDLDDTREGAMPDSYSTDRLSSLSNHRPTLTSRRNGKQLEEESSSCGRCPSRAGKRHDEEDDADEEMERLKMRILTLKRQLAASQDTIKQMQERENGLIERLSHQAQLQFEKLTTKFEDVNLGHDRPTQLVRRYGNLYAETRVDVLDSLDELDELDAMDDLKNKLLLSIVILAFRSAEKTLKEFKSGFARLLDVTNSSNNSHPSHDPLAKDVEGSLLVYLRKTSDRKNLDENNREVCDQVWQTLFDYPCLKRCRRLVGFVSETVRLAWSLTTQNPSYVLEYESERFTSERHSHFHTSNSESDVVKTYVWPGLREGEGGPIVYRGVVIT